MNTNQIKRILLADVFVRRAHIVRVLPRDYLPTYIDRQKVAVFIINTDTSDRPGSHWIGLFYDGVGRFHYFDSFGLPPLHRDIVTFIEHNSSTPFLYNSRTLQDVLSDTCGLYAIYFILIKCRGGTMQRVLIPFTSSHRQFVNDRVIWRLVRPNVLKARIVLNF